MKCELNRLGCSGKFKWEKYVDLSEKTIKGCNEAYWRCAISRAYYGAFCIARGYRRELQELEASDIHDKVINFYRRDRQNKDKQDIGKDLESLRFFRVKSDYWADYPIDKKTAEECIKTARNCLNKMFKFYGHKDYLYWSW